jgi:hypothetical protein
MALPFDTYQRLHLLKQFLTRFTPEKGEARGSLILDVGGFPGILARELEAATGGRAEIITIDRPAAAIKSYIQGNALQLPFCDAAFDAVVCSDVLEHIAPANRAGFIAEIARASRGWLLIGAPFASRAVEQAEASVDDLTAVVTGKPNAWLAEHRCNGLPALGDTLALVQSLGFAHAIIPNGSLFSWFLLKQTELLYEAIPDAFPLFQSLNDLYVRFRAATDHALPTYRHLILAHPDLHEVERLVQNPPEEFKLPVYRQEQDIPESSANEAAEEIAAYAREFLKVVEKVKAFGSHGAGGASGGIDRAYLQRLESIVHEQEAQRARLEGDNARLLGEIEKIRAELESRAKCWWKRMFG